MNPKIQQARANLILEHPFFGSLALRLPVIENKSIKTFRTNGKQIEYNPTYAASLSVAEVQGVLCHEVLHVTNGHCWRRDSRDKKTWNIAADYAINPIILDAGMTLPEGALIDSNYSGQSAEGIFNAIYQEPKEEEGSEGTCGGMPGTGEGSEEDTEEDQEKDQEGEGEEEGEKESDDNGCGEIEDSPTDEKEVLESDWKVATLQAAQAALAQGKLPAGLERLIKELKTTRVDWKAALRRFVQFNLKNDYSWRTPNKRYLASGLYLPSMQSENMPALAIYWDTSGSRDTEEARTECATEVTSIVEETKPEKVYVIYGDDGVGRVDIFEQGEPVTFNPIGGGGTDFRPIFKWIEDNNIEIACLIGITDLYGSFPDREPDYPVLWAKTTEVEPPFGESIKINDN
jgi:predicted metal-dependent peptidase